MLSLLVSCCALVGQMGEPPVRGQPAPDIAIVQPEAIRAPGEYVTLTAKTEAKEVLWIPKDEGLQVLPSNLLKDSKTFCCIAAKPGKYRVLAIAALADRPVWSEAVLVVAGPDPGPPPVPPPPPVVDDLVKRFQAAYATDPSAAKRGQLINLIGLYAAMTDHAGDPSITTTKALLDDLRKVAGELVLPGVLTELRKVISAEIAAALGEPSESARLDPATRTKAVDTFRKISKALEQVK